MITTATVGQRIVPWGQHANEKGKPCVSNNKTACVTKQHFAQLPKDPRILTIWIQKSTAEDIIKLITENKSFDQIHIGAIFNSLTKRIRELSNPDLFLNKNKAALESFCLFVVPIIRKLDSQVISSVCWACGEMNLKCVDLLDSICEEILCNQDLRSEFNAQAIALTLRAFAKLKYESMGLFDAFAEDILREDSCLLEQFNEQSISMTLAAFADQKYENLELFDLFAEEIIKYPKLLAKFTSQNIAVTFRAFGQIKYLHRDLFDVFAKEIIDYPDLLSQFKRQGIAMVLRACVEVKYDNRELFGAFAEEILKSPNLRRCFTAEAISFTLRAFAEIQYKHDGLFKAFADDILNYPQLREQFDSQNIAVTLRAFAEVKFECKQFFDEIADDILKYADLRKQFNSRQLSSTLRAYAMMKYKHVELFEAFAKETLTSGKLRKQFDSKQTSSTLLAFAHVNYLHQDLFDAFANDILEQPTRRKQFSPQAISNTLVAFMLMKYEKRALFDAFAKDILDNPDFVKRFSAHSILGTLKAYSEMNYENRELFTVFAKYIVDHPELCEQYNTEEITITLRTFVVGGYIHPQLFQILLSKLNEKEITISDKFRLLQVYWYQKKCVDDCLKIEWPEWFKSQRKEWQVMVKKYHPSNGSSLQEEIAIILKRIDSNFKEDVWLKINSVDFLYSEESLIIEVDGPTHFIAETLEYLGKDILKQRLLEGMGYRVKRIPYMEWRTLKSFTARKKYLENIIYPLQENVKKEAPRKEKVPVEIAVDSEKEESSSKELEEENSSEELVIKPEIPVVTNKRKRRSHRRRIGNVAKKNLKSVQPKPVRRKFAFCNPQMALALSICAIAFVFIIFDRKIL